MIEMITTITQAELNDLINIATTVGVFMGIGFGIICTAGLLYLTEKSRQKNFKMWLSDIPDIERIQVKGKLLEIYLLFDELATKSNTKLFKSWHNELNRLKSFLYQKWMQE